MQLIVYVIHQHHMLVVVLLKFMGRHCGDLTVWGAIASGAEELIVPEKGINMDEIVAQIEEGKKASKETFASLL